MDANLFIFGVCFDILGIFFITLAIIVKSPRTMMRELLGMKVDRLKTFKYYVAQRLQALLGFLFRGAREPPCLSAADTNDDGRLNIADAIRLLSYLFAAGDTPLPEPFLDCGYDPTDDDLFCAGGTFGCL